MRILLWVLFVLGATPLQASPHTPERLSGPTLAALLEKALTKLEGLSATYEIRIEVSAEATAMDPRAFSQSDRPPIAGRLSITQGGLVLEQETPMFQGPFDIDAPFPVPGRCQIIMLAPKHSALHLHGSAHVTIVSHSEHDDLAYTALTPAMFFYSIEGRPLLDELAMTRSIASVDPENRDTYTIHFIRPHAAHAEASFDRRRAFMPSEFSLVTSRMTHRTVVEYATESGALVPVRGTRTSILTATGQVLSTLRMTLTDYKFERGVSPLRLSLPPTATVGGPRPLTRVPVADSLDTLASHVAAGLAGGTSSPTIRIGLSDLAHLEARQQEGLRAIPAGVGDVYGALMCGPIACCAVQRLCGGHGSLARLLEAHPNGMSLHDVASAASTPGVSWQWARLGTADVRELQRPFIVFRPGPGALGHFTPHLWDRRLDTLRYANSPLVVEEYASLPSREWIALVHPDDFSAYEARVKARRMRAGIIAGCATLLAVLGGFFSWKRLRARA
jgi:hypothetical protein